MPYLGNVPSSFNVDTNNINNGAITTEKIADGAVVNADVSASAAIAGTKISPDFGSQNIATTGLFSHALGTAGAPTITFTGDVNTGIYSPGADQVAISTGGSGRLFVDASGRILVGNSATTGVAGFNGFFQLQGTNFDTATVALTNVAANNTGSYLLLGKARGGTLGGYTSVNNGDNLGQIRFMGADGTGYVEAAYIGVTCNGVPGTNNMPGRLFFSTNSGTSSVTERMCITPSGLVGVGTSTPQAALQIGGSTSTGTVQRLLIACNAGSATTEISLGARDSDGLYGTRISAITNLNSTLASNLTFSTNDTTGSPTERVRIDSSGRVGIGTSSPSANLESQGNVSSTTQFSGFQGLRIQNANGAAFGVTADINFVVGTGTDNRGAVIGAEYTSATSGNDLYFATNPNAVTANDTPIERMRITSAGRVGIGTTSPVSIIHGNATEPVITASQSNTAVVNGDLLGAFNAYSNDTSTNSRGGVGGIRVIAESTYNTGYTPSRLAFYTHPTAANDATLFGAVQECARFDSFGGFYVKGAGTAGVNYAFGINGVAPANSLQIDSSGRLLVGTSTARANFFNSAVAAALQVEGTTASTANLSVVANRGGSAALLTLAASGGSTIGSNTIVANNFALGGVEFCGSDGTEFVQAAEILCEVDGTPGANDMPGRLVFSTTADGAASPTERMRIDSSGRVGIGTTSPTDKVHLHEASSNANYLHITNDTTGSAGADGVIVGLDSSEQFYIYSYENNNLIFGNNNTERARIDSSGRLLVGTSSARSNIYNSTISSPLQVEGTTDNNNSILITMNSAGQGGPRLDFAKSRGASVGSNTLVNADDALGTVSFQGSDGTEFVPGAYIQGWVDGTPGANDMPTRLTFSTTADGASSPTERLRIANDGSISSVIPGGSTLYPRFGCRAWVNFNGTGTVAIRGNGNVSSITDNGTGDYTVNFTTAMADANYGPIISAGTTASVNSWGFYGVYTTSTGSCRIRVNDTSGSGFDFNLVSFAIFR